MELVKKQIHANQVGKKMVDQFLVDDDFNVPDTKNDVKLAESLRERAR